ncbi:MAG: SIMPL domain-containing protein [Prevotella sp.]|nr:SIMPL domain-containing protein [Prevotella sp.]
MKNSSILSAAIVSMGIVCLGWFIRAGIDDFASKDRKVNVKGLAEREVDADKVTWPIVSKEVGNDLPELYQRIDETQGKIKAFLQRSGIKGRELMVNAPQVVDLKAREYGDNNQPYRYIVTSVITVTSGEVDKVRQIIARQGDLLKEGVAIVDGGYENPVKYEFVSFQEMKPKMMQEAIENAEKTAQQFAENSHSKLDKIVNADQGQFIIDDRDSNTPYIKKVRVVATVTYSLKD